MGDTGEVEVVANPPHQVRLSEGHPALVATSTRTWERGSSSRRLQAGSTPTRRPVPSRPMVPKVVLTQDQLRGEYQDMVRLVERKLVGLLLLFSIGVVMLTLISMLVIAAALAANDSQSIQSMLIQRNG